MYSSKDKPLSKTPRKRTEERMREDGYFSWRSKQRKRHITMVKKIITEFGGKVTQEKIIERYENTPNADRKWNLNLGTGKLGNEKRDNKVFAAQIELWTVNSKNRLDGYGENSKPQCPRGYNSDYDVLFQTKEGDLELYESDTHGAWTIIEGEDGELEIANDRDASSADSETVFDFETLKKKFLKEFGTKWRNYQEVAAKTLLDATNFTDDGKKIKKNVDKLNFGTPPKPKGFGTNALEMIREGRYADAGIVYSKAKGYSLALSNDATKEQKEELREICGRSIARLHMKKYFVGATGSIGSEIQTLKDFKSIISKGEGFIAITDKANPDRIHSATCSRLKEDWFVEKVVENKGKSGLYLWYASKAEAQDDNPDTEVCTECNA